VREPFPKRICVAHGASGFEPACMQG
jgi:hypothetical protein